MKNESPLEGCVLLIILGVFAFIIYLVMSDDNNEEPIQHSGMLPAIERFLAEHKEFGTPANVEPAPDWLEGRRQIVISNADGQRRRLLFYTKNQKVVTVYEYGSNGRVKVWGNNAKPK